MSTLFQEGHSRQGNSLKNLAFELSLLTISVFFGLDMGLKQTVLVIQALMVGGGREHTGGQLHAKNKRSAAENRPLSAFRKKNSDVGSNNPGTNPDEVSSNSSSSMS
jgi:hypothetical protein